jgi:hypothetical protein
MASSGSAAVISANAQIAAQLMNDRHGVVFFRRTPYLFTWQSPRPQKGGRSIDDRTDLVDRRQGYAAARPRGRDRRSLINAHATVAPTAHQ